jgi:hypothetical protein
MTELTNTPERQPKDLMHPDSNRADVQPDPKRHRTRGRHRYLYALVPAILLTLTMILSMTHISCTALGADSGVTFDLNPVLAHASLPVHVRACIPSSCASFTVEHWGSEGFAVCDAATCPPLPAPNGASAIEFIDASRQRDWEMVGMLGVQVKDPALTFWRPIWVRLRVSDQAGNSIFDSSAWFSPPCFSPTDRAAPPRSIPEESSLPQPGVSFRKLSYAYPYGVVAEFLAKTRAFAELLIDCEEDRTLRAVLVGRMREG